jgi:exosortase/archaeosortase family protein
MMTVVRLGLGTYPCIQAPGPLRWLFLPLFLGQAGVAALALGQTGATLSPLISLMALLLGLILFASGPDPTMKRSDAPLALLIAFLFVIPSQQLGWLAILSACAMLLWRRDLTVRQRQGLQLIALAAGLNLLITYLMKWFAGPLLALDAGLVSLLLELVGMPFQRQGNLIVGPAGHQLLILRGCSSLLLIGDALLAWWAVMVYRDDLRPRRSLPLALLLVAGVVALNLVRLYLMTLHLDWHQWWHTDAGMQSFQLLSTGLVFLALVLGACRI